jgi:SAM-dependent methyltransferase
MKNTSRVLKKEFAAGAERVGWGSFERQRLLKLWWDSNRSRFKNARVLHFVPEDPVKKFACELPDESFDLVLCSDVLEHVDDKRTLCELHRILSKNGVLVTIAQTIDGGEKSYRDSAISELWMAQSGRSDHATFYCKEFRNHVLGAGFSVEEVTAEAPNTTQFGLSPTDKVFVCHK